MLFLNLCSTTSKSRRPKLCLLTKDKINLSKCQSSLRGKFTPFYYNTYIQWRESSRGVNLRASQTPSRASADRRQIIYPTGHDYIP
uniref:Uncharacterized protein n=1 Tax=Pararge aegeria TaxID=116150 RepID=S4NWE0_9NEOP